jgi:hypothetical protein
MDSEEKTTLIIGAIEDFLGLAEKLEEMIDPDEKSMIEDLVIQFLKALVARFK